MATALQALPAAVALTSPGQVSVQTFSAPRTVFEVLPVLSDGCSSSVLLEILAAFVITVPSGVPVFTLKVNEKTATASTARVFNVQVIEPLPLPPGGSVHVNAGPELCA